MLVKMALASLATLATVGTAFGYEILCNSYNGGYQQCPGMGYMQSSRVRLLENIGDRPCVRGQNWGVRGNYIWVNNGCGGRFSVNEGGYNPDPWNPNDPWDPNDPYDPNDPWNPNDPNDPWDPNPGRTWGRIVCESWNAAYTECWLPQRAIASSVRLNQSFSSRQCIRGQTWGVRGNIVWVTQGCRGEFAFRYR